MAPQSWISAHRDCRIWLPNPGFQLTGTAGCHFPVLDFRDGGIAVQGHVHPVVLRAVIALFPKLDLSLAFSLDLWTTRRWQCCHSEYLQPLPLLSSPSSPLPFYHMQEPLVCLQVLLPRREAFHFQKATKPRNLPSLPAIPLYSLLPKTLLQRAYNLPTPWSKAVLFQ